MNSALFIKSPKPPNTFQVTNTPTAKNANSLISDSKAIARNKPSWCSVASIWRVPNKIVNTAKARATKKAVSEKTGVKEPLVGKGW